MKLRPPVFIVGCPRSGTTLLQSLLAAHSTVLSFPESRFYRSVVSTQAALRGLDLASHHASSRLRAIYAELNLDGMPRRPRLTVRGYAKDFFAALDRATVAAGKQRWLEKTPDHLHFVAAIRQVRPDARFVHILREGAETAASLRAVTQTYPAEWGKSPWPVSRCVERWKKDVDTSLGFGGDPAHYLVSYERLVAQVEPELKRLCNWLELEYEAEMRERFAVAADEVVLASEPWKAGNRSDLRRGPGRFESGLSEAEQVFVRGEVAALQQALDLLFQ